MALDARVITPSATKCLIGGRTSTPQPGPRVHAGVIGRARRDRVFSRRPSRRTPQSGGRIRAGLIRFVGAQIGAPPTYLICQERTWRTARHRPA